MEKQKRTPEQKPEQLHSGHRDRMLELYRGNGLSAFSDVQVLEFLLSYAIPRRDVNPLAHKLLQAFGSLHRVFEVSEQQLMQVPGIGKRSAALIRLYSDLLNRVEFSRFSGETYLRSTAEIGAFLCTMVSDQREERAWLLSMDAKCKVIECREICHGAVNVVNLPPRKLVEAAILANASVVVLAHNHTSGTMLPSLEDLEYTKAAVHTMKAVDVALADHFIISPRTYLSMRASGMMEF